MSRPTSTRNFFGSFSRGCRGFASAMVHAGRCSAALEAGRRPNDDSLRALGIDPAHMDRMNRI